MKKAWCLLSLLLVCIYPGLFMYFQNAGESKITDIFSVTGLFLGAALIALFIYYLLFKRIYKAVGMSILTMLMLINFEIFSKLFSVLPYKYLWVAVVCVIMLVAAALLFKKKEDIAEYLNLIVLIAFSALILVNAIPAIPTIYHKLTVEIEKPQILDTIDDKNIDRSELPNIYYLVFDEYGGSENLEAYFDYDNSEFLASLAEKNFNISYNSRNAESIETVTLMPNLLNLSYVANNNMIADERLAYLQEPALFNVMQYLGYDIITCSSIPFLDNSMSVENFEEQEVFEDKAGYFVLKNSIFIHLYNKQVEKKLSSENPEDKSYGDVLIDAFDYYMNLSDNRNHPQFCMGYFQAPHVPFFYKKDGTLNQPEEYENWLNHDNYLEYLEWTNIQIEKVLDMIIEKDSESIIIIQSDHGARYPVHVLELTGEQPFSDDMLLYQNNILNCVYYKGELLNIEGLSGINTVRYILNQQFNTNFEMLD